MNRSRALLLVLMVALLALASLPPATASTCQGGSDCSGCCASEDNLCNRGCTAGGNVVNCLNNCWAAYMSCLAHC